MNFAGADQQVLVWWSNIYHSRKQYLSMFSLFDPQLGLPAQEIVHKTLVMRIQMLYHQHTAGEIRLDRRENIGERMQTSRGSANGHHVVAAIYIA